MPQNSRILRLCAQDHLGRMIFCWLHFNSAQSSPDLNSGPTPTSPPWAAPATNGNFQQWGQVHSISLLLAKSLVSQWPSKVASLSSGLAGEGVIKHPRCLRGWGRLCEGVCWLFLLETAVVLCIYPNEATVTQIQLGQKAELDALMAISPPKRSPKAQIGSSGCL